MMKKTLHRLLPTECIFFECDIQEKFTKHILNAATVNHNARRLALTAKLLKIPIISTQQLPKIFGKSEKTIADVYDTYTEGTFRHEKTDFSMLE